MIAVCQSEFLAAEDLPDGKLHILIAGIEAVPEMRDAPRSKKATRKNKEVLVTRPKGKPLILNPTNQWAIALLLGTTDWRQWIGKRLTLITDIDVNVETQEPCRSIRVAGSPDATPERKEALKAAWKGRRERGFLCRRYKRAYRMLCGAIPERFASDDEAAVVEPPEPIAPLDAPPERYEPTPETSDFADDDAQVGTDVSSEKAPPEMREMGDEKLDI